MAPARAKRGTHEAASLEEYAITANLVARLMAMGDATARGAKEQVIADVARPSGRRLGTIGALVSVAYLSTLVYWISLPKLAQLPYNELGDFLAGAFAPLAFLWLVLGFIQQGHELRNSARALNLQADELQNSVTQQAALVDVTREQLEIERLSREAAEREADRLAKPHLVLHSGGWGSSIRGRTYSFDIENLGAPCTQFDLANREGTSLLRHGSLKSGARPTFDIVYKHDDATQEQYLTASYIDARGLPGNKRFKVSLNEHGHFSEPVAID
ncbi:hypothetical protein ACFOMD_13370 [Sphingoaurantiacus capsulatus]|uniref:Uncharacterized protein n=1 Tax=Sphingoaurantiacus capsulatus TaxID=1771310 RepID=A0ABV7XBQ5_9SPHN